MTGRSVAMGVSGSGKSHTDGAFAHIIGARFFDGDDLHTNANCDKMVNGSALNDADRAPWLERVGGTLRHPGTVVPRSAPRRVHREAINSAAGAPVSYLFQIGRREMLFSRMTEVPGPDDLSVTADIKAAPDVVVATFLSGLMEKSA
ncbi:hypothetical protein [Loktanella sp. SALINAS62]|uniref:hypothetical protein n=1 Tax=Loktanella sp. SALINAS62 TaxID=2706124 RepID=UPI001B8D9CE1|nr:hypothetical protein [Loktanella sp. SALINAS62]MBS1303233.1 gluconokinase [Loktanella sp. SALINAS62]